MIIQKPIKLLSKPRGFHLITDEILKQIPEISRISAGLCNIFLMHTSAAITINENCDPDVRSDMEKYFNRTVPENAPYYDHTLEGSDDMPAHIKSSILGISLNIPITSGNFNMGTWQGIYLCEHRNRGGSRNLIVTLIGE